MNYIKDPKTWIVLIIIIAGSLGYLYLNREYTRVIKDYEQRISVLDSTHVVKETSWKHDSLSLTDSIFVTKHKLDSMVIKEKESTTTHQVIYRVQIHDSIIEVITTDTQVIKERDQTIVSLNDSIATRNTKLTKLNDSIGILIDSLGKKKTETITITHTDSIHIKPADKKFMIAGGAFVEATNKLKTNYGLNVSADYKILDPVFIGATLQKDGVINWADGYHLQARVGAKFDF